MKGQGHSKTTYRQISTAISEMHGLEITVRLCVCIYARSCYRHLSVHLSFCPSLSLSVKCVNCESSFNEVTENERIIERHPRDIHPLLDYDASESQSTL